MKNYSQLAKFGLAFALSCGIGSAFAADACKDAMSKSAGSGHGVSGNSVGSISGTPWGFEQWYQGGSASMTYYDNGTFKANWNNVIIRETHNVWYKPYGKPGGNHDEGGFMTFSGDMMLNMHNLIGDYKPERKWNLSAGVRAGGWLNVKEGKGGPMLGVGLYNTYRLSDRWKLFADVNYSFIPSMNGVDSGKDHGGNSYAEVNIGIEMALSKNNTFHRVSEKNVKHNDKATLINSFWDNFFVQAGSAPAMPSKMKISRPCR